ncbi:hypothetical protein V6N12_036431 [Hibiscus sabdariffa]|uniref:Uncharacterized protein n=1 Tax=Hibiscus sabdariffa TaxID=183260 RepID=A0ABR2ER41_9ROSI
MHDVPLLPQHTSNEINSNYQEHVDLQNEFVSNFVSTNIANDLCAYIAHVNIDHVSDLDPNLANSDHVSALDPDLVNSGRVSVH